MLNCRITVKTCSILNHANTTAIKPEMECHRYFPSTDNRIFMSWDHTDDRICVSAPCTDNSFFADELHCSLAIAIFHFRRRPSGHWHPTLRPHIAGAPSATLATGSPVRRLQGGHIRTPVAVWHFTTVPGRRLPSRRRCA